MRPRHRSCAPTSIYGMSPQLLIGDALDAADCDFFDPLKILAGLHSSSPACFSLRIVEEFEPRRLVVFRPMGPAVALSS